MLLVPVHAFDISDYVDFNAFIVSEDTGSVALLAVQEGPGGYQGSIADVTLEMRQGTGRVFLDTFPLSKIDTQISTRFAKEIACKYIEDDCPRSDFIYTIRSDSSIIGGPSAGSAIAVLTVALLKGYTLDPTVAVTGTINSGGIIGPVSGLKYKIDVAEQNGFTKVLIPRGSVIEDLENQVQYTPEDYNDLTGIEIIEISDINEAIYEFTGRYLFEENGDIDIPDSYKETMRTVAVELCNRSDMLYQIMKDQFEITDFTDDERLLSRNLEDQAINLTAKAESALDQEQYYSAASYCYGANIKYKNVILLQQRYEGQSLSEVIESTEKEIDELESFVESIDFKTLSDFEIYIIMKERIETARDFVTSARETAANDDIYSSYYNIAYAIERLQTSKVWGEFLGMDGKQFTINREVMRDSCMQKLSETQERIQYIKLFLPESTLMEMQIDLNSAYSDYAAGEFALCISKASRAKSSANVLLNVIKTGRDDLPDLLNRKLSATKDVIIKEQQKNVFPIMGYSYYEYATSMVNSDPVSSLVYAEYALELSWLDIYFSEPASPRLRFNPAFVILVLIGFALGCIFMLLLIPRSSRLYRKRSRRHR
jgi:uncharacterized protein